MVKLRKVQRTPTGTFFVCLPRFWAEKSGLKKGIMVALDEADDGRLIIDAKVGVEQLPRVATVFPGPHLGREIVGRYLLGFDIIRVKAEPRVDLDVRSVVKQTVNSLVGLEIVEEAASEIVLQCLLEPSGFPPEKLLLRNYAAVAGMNRDATLSLVEGDLPLAKNVVVRAEDSERQYFLLVRVLHKLIQDSALREKLGLTSVECLDYRLTAGLVRTMSVASAQIAFEAVELASVKLSEELKTLLANLQEVCCEATDAAVKAFVGKDAALAEKVRNLQGRVDAATVKVREAARKQRVEVMERVLVASASLKRVCGLSVELADLVF